MYDWVKTMLKKDDKHSNFWKITKEWFGVTPPYAVDAVICIDIASFWWELLESIGIYGIAELRKCLSKQRWYTTKYVTTKYVTTKYVTTKYVTTKYVTTKYVTTKYVTTKYVTTKYVTTKYVTTKYVTTKYPDGLK